MQVDKVQYALKVLEIAQEMLEADNLVEAGALITRVQQVLSRDGPMYVFDTLED